jgi:hypothetical protein
MYSSEQIKQDILVILGNLSDRFNLKNHIADFQIHKIRHDIKESSNIIEYDHNGLYVEISNHKTHSVFNNDSGWCKECVAYTMVELNGKTLYSKTLTTKESERIR